VAAVSYCLNPKCPNPSDPSNADGSTCRSCGSELLLQGRYRLVAPLGGGGFGKTYEIDDFKKGTREVLKVLLKLHPKAVSLFKQEADVLSRLHHPGIPRVDTDGYFTFTPANTKDIYHCLVMEKIEGANLQDWLKSRGKPITQDQCLDWLKQLTEILDQVHRLQYFHRDIKPQNIMCKPNGQLVLIDFGTAREVSKTFMYKVEQGQNITGIVSPGYTPQEQTQGKAVPQSDFFALGRTFIFLLTGKPPTAFAENPRTGRLMWRKFAPHIQSQVADVIDYLMAPFPGNRPQNPQMIMQCLAEIDLNAGPSTTDIPTSPALKTGSTKSPQAGSKPSTGSSTDVKDGKKTGYRRTTEFDWKPVFLAGGAVFLLGLTGSQIYGVMRYSAFPTNPIWLINGWASLKFLQQTFNDSSPLRSMVLSPNSNTQHLITASDQSIKIWHLKTGQVLQRLPGSDGGRSLALSLNGAILVSSHKDKRVMIWNVQNAQNPIRMLTLKDPKYPVINALVISPNGQYIIGAGEDKNIIVWNLLKGTKLRVLPDPKVTTINALAISQDSKFLVSGSENSILRWWNLPKGQSITANGEHKGPIYSVAIYGNLLVSSGGDNKIRLWNLQTGKPIDTVESSSVKSLAFSRDGQTLVSGGDTLQVWKFKNGKLQLVNTLLAHPQVITQVAISRDAKTIISVSQDQTIKIWKMP
jgi:serine/threonine protein kinase